MAAESDMRKLVQTAIDANNGKLKIAVQVTDNSHTKVLEHIKNAKAVGCKYSSILKVLFFHNLILKIWMVKSRITLIWVMYFANGISF